MRALENVRVAVWTGTIEDRHTIARAFSHLGCSIEQVDTEQQLLRLARKSTIDLVAATLSADFLDPLKLLCRHEEAAELPPVVVLTDVWGTDLYIEALQLGAFDGISLPIDEKELARIVAAATHGRLRQVA